MKQIPLSNGQHAKVDDADYDDLIRFNWQCVEGYAVRTLPRPRRGTERMHRRILGLATGDPRDGEHEDNDRLNNQRYNLRPATRSQNVMNTGLRADNKSGFKGVSWRRDNKKWQAQLNVNGRNRHLGYFADPERAYEFRCLAADMAHGAFANHG